MTNTNPNPATVIVTNSGTYKNHTDSNRQDPKIGCPDFAIISFCITCVIIVVGWVAVHYFALRREREARDHADERSKGSRRAAFAAFVRKWRSEIDTKNPKDLEAVINAYEPNRPAFWAEVERIRGDFSDTTTLIKLADAVACVQRSTIEKEPNGDYPKPIVEPMDSILEHIRNA